MKKYLVKRFKELFNPSQMQDIDVNGVLSALTNQTTLRRWLFEILLEIQTLNLKIDQGLVSGKLYDLNDLSSRRKALQNILETALSINREVRRDSEHNQVFDLETLTVRSTAK